MPAYLVGNTAYRVRDGVIEILSMGRIDIAASMEEAVGREILLHSTEFLRLWNVRIPIATLISDEKIREMAATLV